MAYIYGSIHVMLSYVQLENYYVEKNRRRESIRRKLYILEKCEKIAISASALGQRTGIEKKEEEKTPFVDSIAESRK